MGQIQSSVGLISGINIDDTITKLLAVSGRPRDTLVNRNKALQSQQAALNELLALSIGVQLSTDRLGKSSEFKAITATTSNKDVLTATATADASPGEYQFQAIQTSQSSSFASNVLTSATQKLSEGEVLVRTGGFVDQSEKLEGLRGGEGISRGKIEITNRAGESRTVDLRFAINVDDVVARINATEGLKVSAKIDGDRIVLTDTTGQTGHLKVEEVNGGQTAADLGIGGIDVASNTATGEDLVYLGSSTQLASLRDGRGLRFGSGVDLHAVLRDGSTVESDLNATADGDPVTVGELVDRINKIEPTKLQAKIAANGNSIELVDLTTGSGNFEVTNPTGSLAEDLGLAQTTATNTITGRRVQSELQGPLLGSLRGGKGLGTLGAIDITNRNGVTTNVDLSSSSSLRDIVKKINDSSAGVVATLNASKTGLLIQDTTGATTSNLKIANTGAGTTATNLKIEADVAKSSVDSGSLGFQFINENTKLADFNQGRGVALTTISFKDSKGIKGTINLNSLKSKTVGGVVQAINDLDIGVEAKLNEAGDGLVLIDTAEGTEDFTVSEVGTGRAAAELGIIGTSTSLTIDGETKKGINSSQNFKVAVASGATLASVVADINKASGPITASVLNAGPNSVRLLVNSRQSGQQGRVSIEGGQTGLAFTTTTQARDAVVAIGASDDFGGTLVFSSTNSFKEIVTGLKVDIKGQSADPVTVQVNSNSNAVGSNIQAFVDQFNKVIDKLKEVTKFDEATKTTGVLFGSTEALRTEFTLTRFVTSRITGAGNLKSLEQLGLSLDTNGKLQFSKAKFQEMLDSDPKSVEQFFTTTETGFSARAKKMIDTISGVDNSILVSRSKVLQKQSETTLGRIDAMNLKLDREKTRLQKQFYGLEQSIAKLQQSQKSIGNIAPITI